MMPKPPLVPLVAALATLIVTPLAAAPAAKKPLPRAAGATRSNGTLAPAAQAKNKWEAEVVEVVGEGRGRINYEAGVVKAVGLGAVAPPNLSNTRTQRVLDARDAAVADALRNLSLAAARVRVTADTRVENYLLKSDRVRVRVEGAVRGAEVIEEKLLPTSGLYRVVVQVPLSGPGSLAEALGVEKPAAKSILVASRPVPRVTPAPLPTPAQTPAPDPYAPGMPAPEDAEYTSLIVDCRGLRVSATMSPKLYDSDGHEVYGTVKCSPDYAIDKGVVAYPRSMDYALNRSRAGERPLIVKARGVADRFRFNPVISNRDADRARQANRSGRFFERTAVLFLVDTDS
jgi:hypothetical protein